MVRPAWSRAWERFVGELNFFRVRRHSRDCAELQIHLLYFTVTPIIVRSGLARRG